MHILYRQSPDVSFNNVIVDFLVHCGVCVCVCVCVQQHSVSGEGQQPASSSRSEKAWLVAKWYNFDTWSVLTVSEWACRHCLMYQHHNNYVCG